MGNTPTTGKEREVVLEQMLNALEEMERMVTRMLGEHQLEDFDSNTPMFYSACLINFKQLQIDLAALRDNG